MKKLLIAVVVLIAIGVGFTSLADINFLGDPVEIMPLKAVKAGMIGYGLSDFGESKGVQRFEVEIKAIIPFTKNKFIVWARAWGGPNNIINRAGIIAGMSGSPIYLKDQSDHRYKLIGALAYGYILSIPGEALAGITPIEEMINNLTKLGVAYYANESEENNFKEVYKFLPNPENLTIPLLITGSKKALEIFKSRTNLQNLPFEFKETNLSTTLPNKPSSNQSFKPLKGGEAISAALSSGDVPLVATGTVTLATSKGFLAFGHPFLETGYSNVPVFGAEIGMVVPNFLSSFKENKGLIGPQLGQIVIDSTEGILGIWNNQNTMIPMKINFSKTYPNNMVMKDSWDIQLAPKTPLSSTAFIVSLSSPIAVGSPNLAYLSVDIEVRFTYEDGGTLQTLPIRRSFFSETGKEMDLNLKFFEIVYKLIEKAKKNLTRIDADINLVQEKKEIPVLRLVNIETAKTEIKPGEAISLGIMLQDKDKHYSKVINLKAPDFQGEMRIKIKDKDSYLEDLIKEALNEPSKLTDVLNFINTATSKQDIFYVEIQYVKAISEQKGADNKGWKEISTKTDEIVNKETQEIGMPEIKSRFKVMISGEKRISVKIAEADKNSQPANNK